MICSQALASACLLLWVSTTDAWSPSRKPAFAARHSHQRVTPNPEPKLSTTKLGMASIPELEYDSDRIRNFSIIAHIDHGAYS